MRDLNRYSLQCRGVTSARRGRFRAGYKTNIRLSRCDVQRLGFLIIESSRPSIRSAISQKYQFKSDRTSKINSTPVLLWSYDAAQTHHQRRAFL